MLARLGFKRTPSTTSSTQLNAFQADWRELEAALRAEPVNGANKKDKIAPVSLEERLSSLSKAILKDTHCRTRFLSQGLLDQLVTLALAATDPTAIHQTLLFCLILLKNDAHLLENSQVHEPLLRFLRTCTDNSSIEAPETEAVLQLIKVICQRLDENPSLLAYFFQPAQSPLDLADSPDASTTTSVSECYIFAVLLRYFHQDDQSGVLARQLLLSLIHLGLHSATEQRVDTTLATELLPMSSASTEASLPLALAEHILDSSFAEALGCSLAAAYSLLPNSPLASDPAMKHFLDLSRFTDDLLTDKAEADRERRLIASSFKEEITLAVKTYFWDNVIRPRLTDNENGEETCRLLELIVRAARDDGGLLGALNSLLIPKKDSKANGFTFPQSNGTNGFALSSANSGSLESLLLRNLNSQDDLARVAALQLMETCLCKSIEAEKLLLVGEKGKHHKTDSAASEEAFVYPQPGSSENTAKKPSIAQELHNRLDQLKSLLRLCGQLELASLETTLDDPTYAPYLASAKARLARSPTFRAQLNQNSFVKSESDTSTPISHTLFNMLNQFLVNSADCNLALSNALTSTSASLLCPSSYLSLDTKDVNALPAIFRQLADKILDLRDRVDGFDRHLQERRESLNLVDALADALGEGDFSSTSDPQSVSILAVQRLHSASDPFAKHYADTAAIQVKVDGEEVSLSTLLTNVVLLSEWGKELVAVVHARTAVGLDMISTD